MKTKITNWGLFPVTEAELFSFREEKEAQQWIIDHKGWIPRGMGRCYGDSSLSENILSTQSFNRFLSFDEKTGIVCCQSGVTFKDLLDVLLPKGWFPPVTPGTKFVSMGGAVASDIHGKNHHKEGTFTQHVVSFKIILPDGKVVDCSREENADLFRATCGGMGLTGMILEVELQMKKVESAWIRQESLRLPNLDAAIKAFEESESWTYSVAWVDCFQKGNSLGRCILQRGEHALKSELISESQKKFPFVIPNKRKKNVPFFLPGFVLNPISIRLYNFFRFNKHPKRIKKEIIDYDTFFYPLDAIENWNRIYGRRGFTQYQFVLPKATGGDALKKIFEMISSGGGGSFLGVLKLFGPRREGVGERSRTNEEGSISFPMEGYTLALDFPLNPKSLKLMNELDEVVQSAGGRLYLTKDVRMNEKFFEVTQPGLDSFRKFRRSNDPEQRIESLQSRRLKI